MFKSRLFIASLLLLAVVTACDDAQEEFSRRPCYLVIDNQMHQDATLGSAMDAMTPGMFCHISLTTKSGARYFSFKNNAGLSSESIFNAIDQRRSLIVGMRNGLIVGFGNLDNPPVFYAFDAQCPNCYDPDMLPEPNHPLSMSDNGIASCGTCHRKYNMNNGGQIIEGDAGKKMVRYRASTAGPFTVLSVN